jgi:hypothetical protein
MESRPVAYRVYTVAAVIGIAGPILAQPCTADRRGRRRDGRKCQRTSHGDAADRKTQCSFHGSETLSD